MVIISDFQSEDVGSIPTRRSNPNNMNPFDKILILSERVRELNRYQNRQLSDRRLQPGPETDRYFKERKRQDRAVMIAIQELESGAIGVEYLERVRKRKNN